MIVETYQKQRAEQFLIFLAFRNFIFQFQSSISTSYFRNTYISEIKFNENYVTSPGIKYLL